MGGGAGRASVPGPLRQGPRMGKWLGSSGAALALNCAASAMTEKTIRGPWRLHKQCCDGEARMSYRDWLLDVPKERLHLLRFRGHGPLVHTKAWIFDDKLAVVGSANYWVRSLSNAYFQKLPGDDMETEVGVGIASTARDADFPDLELAHALRVRLWKRFAPLASFDTKRSNTNITADLSALMKARPQVKAL
jgi:hypothetical protein